MTVRRTTRIATLAFSGVLLATSAVGAVVAGSPARAAASVASPAATSIVSAAQRPKFGQILVNAHGQALYYWSKETTGTVKCTGSCATVWPPLLLTGWATAPKHVAGVMGTFGVVMRPDGGHQLTLNGHPLYTFQGDKTPSQILCDGVDGWHVYRLGH